MDWWRTRSSSIPAARTTKGVSSKFTSLPRSYVEVRVDHRTGAGTSIWARMWVAQSRGCTTLRQGNKRGIEGSRKRRIHEVATTVWVLAPVPVPTVPGLVPNI